jgi:hypothetical protein
MKKTLDIYDFKNELESCKESDYYKKYNNGEAVVIMDHMDEVWDDFNYSNTDIFMIWTSYKSLNDFLDRHHNSKFECELCRDDKIRICASGIKKTKQEIIQDHLEAYNMNGTAFEVVSSEYNMKTREREAITTYLVADFSNH